MSAFEDGALVTEVTIIDDALYIPFWLPSEPHEGLHLASKENTSVGDGVVERFDPESVPSDKLQPPLDVVQNKCELAAQMEQEVETITLVPGQAKKLRNEK